jgi:hypothetical protein
VRCTCAVRPDKASAKGTGEGVDDGARGFGARRQQALDFGLRFSASARAAQAAAEPPTSVIITHAEKRATWMKLIGEQMKSGLNGRDFCSQRGLNYPNYAGARLRLIGKIRKSGRAAE